MRWYGVRPGFLIAGAVALLGFGVIFGVALDVATRPNDVSAPITGPAPAPKNITRPPVMTNIPAPDNAGSILQRPTGEPLRAWPEPKAAPADEKTPLLAYAVPSNAAAERPVIAIVIDDMGVDRTRALRAIDLPGPLTVSLMTYADGLPGLVTQAREHVHEVMAHLPMEPLDPKENPGPGALTIKMDDGTIQKVFAADLDSWKGYVGINNHMGSKFTRDKARMNVVMQELKNRGLLWLDSKTIAGSAGLETARAANVPYLERDVFLDDIDTAEEIKKQLGQTMALAKARGTAIAIGHPHDLTLAALKQWLPTLEANGVSLVPISEILKRRQSQTKETPRG